MYLIFIVLDFSCQISGLNTETYSNAQFFLLLDALLSKFLPIMATHFELGGFRKSGNYNVHDATGRNYCPDASGPPAAQ